MAVVLPALSALLIGASAPVLPPVAPGAQLVAFLGGLIPREALESQASREYRQVLQQAAAQGRLAGPGDPQMQRLQRIARRVIAQSDRYSDLARSWDWEVNLIRSSRINAFCMPGGKIAVYSGIIDKLNLTDDELAVVVGHEVAHALREHARERIGKAVTTDLGIGLLTEFLGIQRYRDYVSLGGQLLTLKFSRDDEADADRVGLELTARSGYDPRAAIRLWEKMSEAGSDTPLEFLSTHPANRSRIDALRAQMPEVLPLYEQSRPAVEPAVPLPVVPAPSPRPDSPGTAPSRRLYRTLW